MSLPLVSIITPSFNQGRFIRKTIESVLNQSYPHIEYIIIDGGSTDETACIVQEYKERVTFISETDRGQSDAINKGLRLARGEIVGWLNSDDVYELDCVEKAVKEFEKDNSVGLVYGEGYIIDECDNRIKVFEATQNFDLWTLVNVWDYIMQPTAFFRKKYIEKVGFLDINLSWCMDWDLWIRLALEGKVRYIPSFMASSREYSLTKTSTGGEKRLEEIKQIMEKYSGMTEPIGYQLYALNTKAESCKADPFLYQMYQKILIATQKAIFDNLPVRYADGWIGKVYKTILGPRTKQIEFIIDNILPSNLPQTVSIIVNGNICKEIYMPEVKLGQKEVIKLTEYRDVKYLDIVCQHVCCPSEEDQRTLGVIIREINYLTED